MLNPPNSLKISDLIAVLENTHFSSGWADEPTLKSNHEQFIELADLSIVEGAKEILKFFHLVFLNGDYNFYSDNLSNESDIAELKAYLKSVGNNIEDINDKGLKEALQGKFQWNINSVVNNIENHLTYFVRDLLIQFNLEHKKGLFRVHRKIDDYDVDLGVRQYLASFIRLVKVIKIEHFGYRLDNKIISDLLVFEKEWEHLTLNHDLKSVLRLKVNFLLKKLIYRQDISKVGSKAPELVYSFDSQDDRPLSVEDIDVQGLSQWDEMIKVHYGLVDNFKSKQRDRRRSIEAIKHDEYLFENFHGLIKIFKDDTRSIEQSTNLSKLFLQKERPSLKVNMYSFKCTDAYLFNNVKSLQCDTFAMERYDIEDLIYEIRNKQNQDGILNYFPWLRLGERISKEMDALSSKLIDQDNITRFGVLLELYQKVLKSLHKTYDWSVNKYFIPFQLPHDECKSNFEFIVDGYSPQQLYFHSSFVLPLDYSDVEVKKNELDLKKETYVNLYMVYDKLKYVFEKVESVADQVRKQERRSIEVIAIFSAVALFSVGSIQIFGKDSVAADPLVYYKFVLSYGFALSSFVLLIWIITRDNIRKIHWFHWVAIIGLMVVTFIVLGFVLDYPFIF